MTVNAFRIGSWFYEMNANAWIQFITFRDSRRKERIFENTMFYIENGNALYIS